MGTRSALVILTVGLGLWGCSSPPTSTSTWLQEGFVMTLREGAEEIRPGQPGFADTVQIRWLGVSGYLITLGGKGILIDPFFSKQPLPQVLGSTLNVNTALIDRKFPEGQDIEAILVGHAHYDHLFDVPYIMKNHVPHAPAYGSRTAVNILAGCGIPESRRIQANLGTWTYTPSRRIRFAPFESEHAPHLGRFIHLWRGEVEDPLEECPERAGEYLEGMTLSYLIEFLDDRERPVFTIFHQDSASNLRVGTPTIPHRPVDVAILTLASWKNVDGYPDDKIRRLAPKNIICSHYDDFFGDPEGEMKILILQDNDGFLQELQKSLRRHGVFAAIHYPYTDTWLHFPLGMPKVAPEEKR